MYARIVLNVTLKMKFSNRRKRVYKMLTKAVDWYSLEMGYLADILHNITMLKLCVALCSYLYILIEHFSIIIYTPQMTDEIQGRPVSNRSIDPVTLVCMVFEDCPYNSAITLCTIRHTWKLSTSEPIRSLNKKNIVQVLKISVIKRMYFMTW